ncbi:fluoride efflux transporter CrcB [Dysgonomonas sp. 520]|uniref:fluoride efflux transporter CrcB n=1 Tax=Dysgonomonas sp. 520 TaxID=2302931 RepID=UPI0013D40D23|nr:fluoride efflux transporter CrcB [Dysgonomonas sp. 520]NDW09117.1 fluoride efflux transporter CrcB [Dysgonomonas sp. 520]
MLKNILLVGLGGGVGSILRFLATELTHKYYFWSFPLATFLINIVGCFCIGMLVNLIQIDNHNMRYLLVVGFCGGFTTFSTFARETMDLMQTDHIFLALLYVAASCLIGVVAVWLGMLVTK